MTVQSGIFSAWAATPGEVLRENLAARKDLSISGFYLPAGQRLTFSATPGIDRLHLLLRGRCRLIQGGTELMVESGHALGIAAPGAHQLEADQGGVAFFTLALRRPEDSVADPGGGLTILDVLGPGRPSARRRIDEWATRPTVRGRVTLLPLEQIPPGPVQIFPSSERLFLVLEGSLRLETPLGTQTFSAPGLYEVAPDVPHQLLPPLDVRTTVVAISDPEPAESIVTHFSCGHRARFCDLVRHTGDGQLQLNAAGELLELNQPAARWLGLPDSSTRGLLAGRLLPRDAQWLTEQLARPDLGGPTRTVWASPAVPDLALSVLLVPYQGEQHLTSALLYLRPMLAPPEAAEGKLPEASASGLELPQLIAQSPTMADLYAQLPKLAADYSWVVVWGETGTGKSTVARLLHRLGPGAQQPYRVLNCANVGAETLPQLLFTHNKSDGDRIEAGPWLQSLGGGTLVLDQLHTLPLAVQNRVMRGLSELKEAGRAPGRVIIELDHRPQKGLPTVSGSSRLPRRGAFITLGLPALRDRPEDLPLLLRHYLEKELALGSSLPVLSGDALEVLLNHPFPHNLHDLERLAKTLAAGPLGGAISAAVVRPLLGRRRNEALFGNEPEIPTLIEAERELLLKALRRAGGNKAETSRLLGITRTRLYRMLVEHQLEV